MFSTSARVGKFRPRRRGPGRSGATAVEAAIVLPIVILVMLAAVDFGRAMHAKDVLSNAVRVGAEYGATHRFTVDSRSAWEARLQEALLQEAGLIPGFDPEAFASNVTTSGVPDDQLRVHVAATYDFRTTIDWPFAPLPIVLHHSVTMRQYQ